MPELPEVETVLRGISPHVAGQKVEEIIVHDTRLRWPVQTQDLLKFIDKQKVLNVQRRSKYLLFHMENDAYLVIHLGMTGRLGVWKSDAAMEKHTHLVFQFANFQMRFRDPRRFGIIEVVPPGSLDSYARLQALGVEPLEADFTADYLYNFTQKSTKPIKNLIMDAKVVVGVGNIYASESLFAAKIHPAVPAKNLSFSQIKELTQQIKNTLHQAIAKGGSTLNDYRSADGEPGYFQLEIKAYGREHEPCLVCGTTIEKIVLAGRSSFYCPNCQKS